MRSRWDARGPGPNLSKTPPGTQSNQKEVKAYPLTDSVTVVLRATSTPQQAPSIRVPFGSVVRARATNNAAGNTAVIFVSTDPRVFAGGGGTPLQPLDDVQYPVESLGQIWVYGTFDDGVVLSITKNVAG